MARESEQTMHEQREWLRVTLASIGDAVITTDTSGNVTFLNPVAESLTGWALADAMGKSLTEVFHIINEETRNQVESPTARSLREGVVVGLANHTLLIAKDGTERPIDDSAAPIRNAKNEVAGVVLVFRDITERKRAEQDTAHLAAIVASSDDAIISKDLNGIITSWNQGAQRLFGYAAEEVIGKPISLLIPAGHEDEEPMILARLRRGDAIEHYETVRQRKDGSFLDISLTVSPVRDASGQIIGASKIARDITERKRLEADLEASEIRYRRLFEAAKDGILILDTVHGKVTDANPFMADLLGYSKEELVGQELWEIGLLKDASESRAMVRELKDNNYIRYEHLPLETTAGRKVEVEVVANVYQEDHHPVIQCNIRDITERRRLEDKTKEQAKSLADLHRRKDEFLAMLSHELRNPLAPIQNAVHLLRLQQDRSPLQVEAHGMIERQVSQLVRLVDDLLEVSRIACGGGIDLVDRHCRPFDVKHDFLCASWRSTTCFTILFSGVPNQMHHGGPRQRNGSMNTWPTAKGQIAARRCAKPVSDWSTAAATIGSSDRVARSPERANRWIAGRSDTSNRVLELPESRSRYPTRPSSPANKSRLRSRSCSRS